MKAHIGRMLRAVAWADREMLAALEAAPAAQGEALPILAHVLAAEHIWLSRLEGRQQRLTPWSPLSLAECRTLAEENAAGYAALCGRLSDEELPRAVHYRNLQGEPFVNTALDILTHVAIHGAYHRGQVAKMIGRTGAPAPNTDFITFVRSIDPVV